MKTMEELEKEYKELELLEEELKNAPDWALVKTKETKQSDEPNDVEIYNLYYNSNLEKSVKIIKNPFTKICSMSNVEVKDLKSNDETNQIKK